MGSEYYAADFEKLSRGKEFFAFVCSSFLSVSVWKALVICCEVLRTFYFQRLFLAVDCGDTYNQSFSLYNTVTLCPLLTASSSSTQGWKSCSTNTLWRGRDGSISSCSFSSPTRTNVSILAEPVMRPRGASVSLSLRTRKYIESN